MIRRNKVYEKEMKCTLRELPYFGVRGDIATYHGRFNNSLFCSRKSKRSFESMRSLYDLDIFSLNAIVEESIDNINTFPFINSIYYSPNSFQKIKSYTPQNRNEHDLAVFHSNIRSIRLNLENLENEILGELDYHFDIIGLTETKITNSNVDTDIPRMPGYNFEYVPTPLSAGGVGLFIDDSLDYVVLEKTSDEAFQALWIELCCAEKKSLVCGIIYRQHNSPEKFQKYFEETIENFTSSGKRLCLLGDINVDLLKSDCCHYAHDFLSTLLSCYLIPTIDKPTRVHKHSATLIDNIFVNNPEQVEFSGNIVTDVTDHFSQFCIMKSVRSSRIKRIRKKRDFSRLSADAFKKDVSCINWNAAVNNSDNDVNKSFSSFFKKLNHIINKHAPVKAVSKRKLKQLYKPWITRGLKKSIKIKNKLFFKGDLEKYKNYRNKLKTLIRASKKQHYHKYFEDNITNMKKTWEGINRVLSRKSKSPNCLTKIKNPENNKMTKDPSKIPNILNKHFASVGRKLDGKLPPSQQDFHCFLSKANSPKSSFFFEPVTTAEVRSEILSMSNNKSYGLYSCPTHLLKEVSDVISQPLASLFNMSVSQCSYPEKFKLAKIVPIFKSGDVEDPNNYRPISLLSNFNRIFEKLVYTRMISFINTHNLLYNAQYGFRKSHSTQHAILDIVNSIQSNMDKGHFSCGIFIDLKKAFDTVNHDVLLNKLQHYGFRGTISDWFSSYLTNRKQTTDINGYISEQQLTTCGVPQGSVLGPLLFLIYMNDIQYSSTKFKFFLFADDTNILYADKHLRSLESVANAELTKVYEWLTANRLTLNIKKSNYVIFRPYQKTLIFQPKIYMYDNEKQSQSKLECNEYVKYLGMLLDKNLSFKNHIDLITIKISKTVGMIAKLRHFLPRKILIQIYNSLIGPYISYAISVWGSADKCHLNKILILQKRALRFIYFAEWKEHAIPFFLNADILPVNFLYYENVCSLMHDVRHKTAPENIIDLFTDIKSVHSYNTRSSTSHNFYIKQSKLQIQYKSFSRLGARIWNDIPVSLREKPKRIFKSELHRTLLNVLKTHDDYLDISQIGKAVKLL